jgi:hypothetical protein
VAQQRGADDPALDDAQQAAARPAAELGDHRQVEAEAIAPLDGETGRTDLPFELAGGQQVDMAQLVGRAVEPARQREDGAEFQQPRRFGFTRILAACAFLLIAPAILLPYWLALACGVGIAGGAALIRDTVRYCAAVTVGPKP